MTDAKGALAAATARLAAAGVESAQHDAETLLAWVVDVPRSRLMQLGRVDRDQAAAYETAVGRRERREPLQHITGVAGFRYLDLEVGPGVFVPRPETEVMAGQAVDEVRRLQAAGVAEPVVVDLCTGSGAVALAIATEGAPCQVSAVELSAAALAYARRNADRVAAAVDLRLGDVSDAAHLLSHLLGAVHVVTANPPYIPLWAFESVAAEARDFDPPVALWSGEDGLDAIRVVAGVAARLLTDGGLVLCEHADVQGESAPDVFAATGEWRAIADQSDLARRPRFVSARRVGRRRHPAGTMSS